MRAQDDFAASLLDDIRKDPEEPAGKAELVLLRNWIELSGYDGRSRPYVHCFVFARQGELAYAAMGPLYGSTRDGSAPLCAPQGGLFDLPPWKQLHAAFVPAIGKVSQNAGTIRFASYAGWSVQELRATLSPLDFLQAAKVPLAADPAPAIGAMHGRHAVAVRGAQGRAGGIAGRAHGDCGVAAAAQGAAAQASRCRRRGDRRRLGRVAAGVHR